MERKRLMNGLLDQERLQEIVNEWKEEGGHKVFLRLSGSVSRMKQITNTRVFSLCVPNRLATTNLDEIWIRHGVFRCNL